MPTQSTSLSQMVTALVPTLSRSLAEQFNVFRVMHHGTHEKQLSNVFAWLLRPEGTHDLGNVFQRLFVDQINRALPTDGQLPTADYRVLQEVDTTAQEAQGRDIADIVLTNAQASVVVENYEMSDGHGHDFHRYEAYGAEGGKQSVVVLLCVRPEGHRQTGGWEKAVVLTYAEVLSALKDQLDTNEVWQRSHPQQLSFIQQMFLHFLEGPSAMSNDDRIAFIRAMCETGESARYGHRPQKVAAEEFANLVGQHAQRQFEEGRATLRNVKRSLKQFAESRLTPQVNEALQAGKVAAVKTRFVGQWEWCVELQRLDGAQTVYLEFGPTASVQAGRAPMPLNEPDYTKVFVTRQASEPGVADPDAIDQMLESAVGLNDVLAGLSANDTRLRDAVLAVMAAD